MEVDYNEMIGACVRTDMFLACSGLIDVARTNYEVLRGYVELERELFGLSLRKSLANILLRANFSQ